MRNCGKFLNMAKRLFLVCFFQALMLLWFVFCVSGKFARVLKMLVFPVFWAFVRWLILVYLGLEGLGFCVSCFVFLLCVGFVSVLFALFLFFCWMLLFLFLFFLSFLFVIFWFLFFGGFKGQVRWPKGPPHLALNPPYLFCFVFSVCFFVLFLVCFFFVFVWRV